MPFDQPVPDQPADYRLSYRSSMDEPEVAEPWIYEPEVEVAGLWICVWEGAPRK